MPAPLFVIDRGDTFVVRGNAWSALVGAGIKPFHAGGTAQGFIIDSHRLRDLCAYLESRRIPYRMIRGDCEPAPPKNDGPADPGHLPQRLDGRLDLFGGAA